MELASIIVPVYNIEKYLPGCIESLLVQTYEKTEIILVDDGGMDTSADICDKYAEKYTRVKVLHKENGGLSDARNKGAEQAHGKYLFFVDGDDTVSPDMVEKAVLCAEELDADMVFFDFESIEEETGRRDWYHYGFPQNKCLNAASNPELLIKSPSACCCMYSRSFWDESGIRYPKGLHYEDLATTPRFITKAEKVGYVGDKPMYYYMLRQGSIMRSNNFERSYKDRTTVMNFLLDYFHEEHLDEEFKTELEYLVFQHCYFIPSKEIILADTKSIWLDRFRTYAIGKYPDIMENAYISELSEKDEILLFFMKRKMYWVMNLLSGMRKAKDRMKRNK